MSSALIYIRQSRHRDYERTASPEVQKQACLALPGVADSEQLDVFEDLDASGGGTRARKGYLALLERIKAGGVGVVAAYDQSRAFRNTADALEFYALMEKHPEIEVVFVHGRFDRSPAGEFTYTTLAAAHAMERRMTAEKMRDAVRYKSARGDMVGQVPAGYMRDADGTVTIHEPTAELIRGIFTTYASGAVSTRELAHRLNEAGTLLPAARTSWRGDTVAQLLANVAYIGKTYSESRRRRQGRLIPGNWPRLVDEETWLAVQRHIAGHRPSGGHKRLGGDGRAYVFQRLLRCSCGRKLHAQTIRKIAYYRCPGTDALEPCRHLVREDRLLLWAESLFRELARFEPADFDGAVRSMIQRQRTPEALPQLEARIGRLGQRFEWGHIDAEAYREEWERLHALKAEIHAMTEPKRPLPVASLSQAWERADEGARRELLLILFDELDVDRGSIVGFKPRPDRAAEVTWLMHAIRYRGWLRASLRA